MQTDRLYLRISPDLKRQLETLAQADRRQVSDYVRLILEDHINKESTMSKQQWNELGVVPMPGNMTPDTISFS